MSKTDVRARFGANDGILYQKTPFARKGGSKEIRKKCHNRALSPPQRRKRRVFSLRIPAILDVLCAGAEELRASTNLKGLSNGYAHRGWVLVGDVELALDGAPVTGIATTSFFISSFSFPSAHSCDV